MTLVALVAPMAVLLLIRKALSPMKMRHDASSDMELELDLERNVHKTGSAVHAHVANDGLYVGISVTGKIGFN